ncbi:hypothetical protein ES703_89998 [subsurface metagenome]
MSAPKPCFKFEDFHDQLPDPGFYPSSIKSARFRRSAAKNRMLQIGYTLEGVEPAYQQVADYFVLEGERVSPAGISLARRRLVQLYRACRIFPKQGDEIAPKQLLNARLQVRVEHEQWQGRPQLRVVAYRPLQDFLDSEQQNPL